MAPAKKDEDQLLNMIKALDGEQWLCSVNIYPVIRGYFDTSQNMIVTKICRAGDIIRFKRFCDSLECTKPSKKTYSDYMKALKAKGGKDSSVRSVHERLKGFFRYLDENDLYEDITKGFSISKVEIEEKKPLSNDEANFLFESESNLRVKLMIGLMLFCGLRCVEVAELKWGDIKENRAFIRGKGKRNKTTQIVIPVKIQSLLDQYKIQKKILTQDDDFVFSTCRNGVLFPMNSNIVSNIVRNHLRAVFPDKPHMSAHILRHTAITLAAKSGLNVVQLAKFARHSNIQTTLTYMHDTERFTNPTEQILENLITEKRKDDDTEKALKLLVSRLLTVLK